MRVERLGLLAFGHFRDYELDFTQHDAGLQIVYGTNEAGKSTALRAIRALLYGVPQQSQDTFLTEGKDIRISAVLSSQERRIEVVRRKGRKNTLLTPAGATMPESVLAPFLGGVDEKLFSAMFGLDHESLRQGAHALLALEGRVGETLFGAGLGTTSVRRMLSRFRALADDIFTSKGRSKRINQEVTDVRRARELVSENSTSAAGYLEAEEKLQLLQTRLEQLGERRRALTHSKNDLERRLRVLPLVAQRRSYLEQLAHLGQLPVLPADAEQQRQHAVKLLQEARVMQEHAKREMTRVSERLQAISLQPKLLELPAEQIEALSERLGGYRKARLDLPKRQAELGVLQGEVQRQLRRLGSEARFEQLDELRLTRDEEARIRRLIREKTQYDTKLAANAAAHKRAEAAVLSLRRELAKQAPETDTKALERALVRAQKHGELERELEQAKVRLAAAETRLRGAREAMGPFVLATVEAPLAAKDVWRDAQAVTVQSIAVFESKFESLAHQRASIGREIERLQERQISLEQALLDMTAQEDIPSDAELQKLRGARDRTLSQLGEQLQTGHSTPQVLLAERGKAIDLVALLSEQVARSDAYADRIRTMADRVAERRAKDADAREQSAQLKLRLERQAVINQAQQQLELSWQAVWDGSAFVVRSAGEMRLALQCLTDFEAAGQEREVALAQVRRLEHALSHVVAELSDELARVGEPGRLLWESLGQFVQRLETVLETQRAHNSARRTLSQRLELEQGQLTECQTEQGELKVEGTALRSQWQKIAKRLGLPKDTGPEDVSGRLDALAYVFKNVDEAQGLQRRIAGMERDNIMLCDDICHLCSSIGMPVDASVAIDTLGTLVSAHRQARAAAEERKLLQDELAQRQAAIERSHTEVSRAQAMLQGLFEAAGVNDADALNHVLQRVHRANELRAAIDAEERRLLAQGEGASVDELVVQCQGLQSAQVQSELSAMQDQLHILERDWEELTTLRAAGEQSLGRLSKGAADAAEDLEAKVARLKVSVRRYVRFRLAATLLEAEIERYREAHQGPVIGRANVLFPQLTLGRYTSLRVDYDARDEPILLCCTRDERRISVDGLSDGTRDQLYLSLRLASLEHYMQTSSAMPLVLDDILVHFDDERAKAALKVLNAFSQHTQILFFTHHARLVELARQVVSPAQLSLHTLAGVS